ncbi:amino acid deaminase/aldolase [Amycolatopsis sp. cmx-11-12]|uniref:amino acid deaminase/aldolase n=1 Tax=Amycolatopsis sp. cmx-11-12 TaxID=2785795 RepID=UPI00391863DA
MRLERGIATNRGNIVPIGHSRHTGAGFAAIDRATAEIEPSFAVIDLGALRHNAKDMVRRAGGKPIRVASKSVRCRALLRYLLDNDGFAGILAYTLREALWLGHEYSDIVVGYPTGDREALRELAASRNLASRITIMVDSLEHLEFIASAIEQPAHSIRVCLDIDASYQLAGGRLYFGVRRSIVRTPDQAYDLARAVDTRRGFLLVGVMCYEAQIAGLGDNTPGSALARACIRAIQHRSGRELRKRRAVVVSAIEAVTKLEFVNGGGTGSLERTASEPVITELAAGSGLYGPTLFDNYRAFQPCPAAFFALSVVRRASPTIVTVAGGGWIASGGAGRDRLPTPTWPPGLRLTSLEGAGEVQTPVAGPAAADLHVGDRVWFRHAKAGELCERVESLHIVDGDTVVATVPTYRGEGKTFG